ncbi:MAG: hypothetical protein R3211_06805 [Balneolaceae bacterium]|nr:hypothetical protein [Balneolaceae bacterium]
MNIRESHGTITVGDWVLTLFLTFIPIVGIIMLFVWAFGSNTHPIKANWAKASLIWVGIAIVLYIIFGMVIFSMFSGEMMDQMNQMGQ